MTLDTIAPHVVRDLGHTLLIGGGDSVSRGDSVSGVHAQTADRFTGTLGAPPTRPWPASHEHAIPVELGRHTHVWQAASKLRAGRDAEGDAPGWIPAGTPRSASVSLAGLFALQMLGQVASLGGGRLRATRVPLMDTFSSADAAIDSCVALATSAGYGVAPHSAAPLLQTQPMFGDDVESAQHDWEGRRGTKTSGATEQMQDAILLRLGITEVVLNGRLPLRACQAGVLIDHVIPTTLESAATMICKCGHQECSHACLEKARAVFNEARVLFRHRRFEEGRSGFEQAALRLAAYSNKTEANTGFPRWGEGRRLNKEWAQLAFDTAMGVGECCLNLGHYPEAILECTTALTLEPDNLQALYARGLAYTQLAKAEKRSWADSRAGRTQDVSLRQKADRPRLLRYAWKVLLPGARGGGTLSCRTPTGSDH